MPLANEWPDDAFETVKKLFVLNRIPEEHRTEEDRQFLNEVKDLVERREKEKKNDER